MKLAGDERERVAHTTMSSAWLKSVASVLASVMPALATSCVKSVTSRQSTHSVVIGASKVMEDGATCSWRC